MNTMCFILSKLLFCLVREDVIFSGWSDVYLENCLWMQYTCTIIFPAYTDTCKLLVFNVCLIQRSVPLPVLVIGDLSFFKQFPVFRKESPHVVFRKLQKEYGGLYAFKLGSAWFLVLSKIDVVKEALLHKQDQFSGRIRGYSGKVKMLLKFFSHN